MDPLLAMQRRGFDTLFRHCLRVTEDDILLVLADESMRPIRRALVESTLEVGCDVTIVDVPFAHQLAWVQQMAQRGGHAPVPSAVMLALDNASVILNALSGDQRTTSVRQAIVQQQRRKRSRLAHVPGIDHSVLAVLAETPVDQVECDCELVGWALGEAHDALLISRSGDGRTHRLTMQLEGWRNEPLLSTGIIQADSWGNVPPAEVFVCPRVSTINGTVCINGSIPGKVLSDGSEAILTFSDGRLTGWQSRGPRRPAYFFTHAHARARDLNDENWNVLCELGIGLNPAVTELTGNSLFDEKAAGTVHIAIGSNYGFGHPVRAHSHSDLVIRNASLVLSGHVVLDDGVLTPQNIHAWRDGTHIEPLELLRHRRLDIVEAKIESRPDGLLMRRLLCAGRIGHIRMATDADARALTALVSALPQNEVFSGALALDIGRTMLGMTDERIEYLMGILRHYEALRIVSV